MECTKVNCPMQAGTPTDNCGESCPWRTTAKTSDLISRKAAKAAIRGKFQSVADRFEINEVLNELPIVDALPVVHGRWVKMTGMMPPEYHGHFECSECQWHMKGLRNSWTREEEMTYCPNCGAKMDGRESE